MNTLKRYTVAIVLVLLPLFFVPITREYFETNKAALLLIISTVVVWAFSGSVAIRRSNTLQRSTALLFMSAGVLIVYLTGYTALYSSNPHQDLVTGILGTPTLLSILVFSFCIATLSKTEKDRYVYPFLIISAVVESALIALISIFPQTVQLLTAHLATITTKSFNTFGNIFDLYAFFLFVVILLIFRIHKQKHRIIHGAALCLILFAISINVARSPLPASYQSYAPVASSAQLILERTDTPQLLLFGSGIKSFEWSFPLAKDARYNTGETWQTSTYVRAPSALIQLAVEGGLVGVVLMLSLLIVSLYLNLRSPKRSWMNATLLTLSIALFVLFPVSLYALFQLFLIFGLTVPENGRPMQLHRSIVLPMIVVAGALTWSVVLFARYYQAEIAARQALTAVANQDAEELYRRQGEAVSLFPYGEQYRVAFSQTNVLLAQELAAQQQTTQEYMTRAVQTAIQEAQSAVALNPKRASNWANLGSIYGRLLGVEGASTWAIAAFQRAILLDPQNVGYRLELGTIYYSLRQYTNAVTLFEEASTLKPSQPTTLYHLAYSYYYAGAREKAESTFDRLLAILERTAPDQYDKVRDERIKLFGR